MTEKPCISFKLKRKNGRSWMITPDGKQPIFEKVLIDNALLQAFAKACLWERDLEKGKYTSIRDLSTQQQKFSESYIRHILLLNELSPKIQMAIMDGSFPKYIKLKNIFREFSQIWAEQEKCWL